MIGRLLDRLERRVTFIVGKGGVGKTTTAGAIALALADRGEDVRLVSTDPAHSVADLFAAAADGPSPCTPRLILEELDADAHARARLGALEPGLRELIDRGTYLDTDDAASLLEGSVPGLYEIGAALRIQELVAAGGRLVIDTAPTGHTLRLLDAPDVVAGWVAVFRAMAAKADTVASALVGAPVRHSVETALDDLGRAADAFADAARAADVVLVTGPGAVVRAETARLRRALEDRGCRVAAVAAVDRPGAEAEILLPFEPALGGCASLRAWLRRPAPARGPRTAVGARAEAAPGPGPEAAPGSGPEAASRPEADRPPDRGGESLVSLLAVRELVVFAGKGGVGKTTCAAAAAVLLADHGAVLLAGADPAGSLRDVLADPPAGLEVREMDAEGELERFREIYREEVRRAFEAVGLDRSAGMDRDVVESLWGLAPPGIDEVVAVAKLATADEGPRVTVLDTAPTGHFLRLIAMPDLARDWVGRIMRILLKYRALGGLDAPAESLVRFARRLRALQERLSDPSRTAIVIVTLDEPLVRAETRRLLGQLDRHGLAPAAVLVNRAPGARAEGLRPPAFRAPEVPEPVGADRLRALGLGWERIA
ncbi:MAG TPA: ArsA-related P-loop ATPase [Longimicrobiales bacterium]|nr:ArsA-related P-loop ATPase [Longimicrobiales bacterium]